jgi:hypothetical protein
MYSYEVSKKIQKFIKKKEESGQDEYEVDKIKSTNSEGKYLVSWKGYDSSYDTWEPFENICHTEAFDRFQVNVFCFFGLKIFYQY